MHLLHLDSSILGEHSISRQVSRAITDRMRDGIAGLSVTYRDLANTPLLHLSGTHMAARNGIQPEAPADQQNVAAGQQCLDEFLDADIVVIGAPMYNFSAPTQLKAWIDRILVAGKTFAYTEAGPEGLMGGKRVIVAIARGGFFGEDSPYVSFEHLESYLRTVFRFIGITDPEFILAEGISVGPEQRERALKEALKAASALNVG